MRRQRPTATITATEEGALTAASTSAAATVTGSGGKAAAGRAVVLERVPLALTCGLYRSHVLVDPTSEEEALAGSLVTVVLDQGGTLHGRKAFWILGSGLWGLGAAGPLNPAGSMGAAQTLRWGPVGI